MKTFASFLVATAMTLASITVDAQSYTYTCSRNGRSYQSSQPCSMLGVIGPTTAQRSYEAPAPSAGLAPSHLQYLSPRCASLNDAIRTAPVRGLKYDTIGQMQREYNRECAESESEASRRLSEDRSDQRKQLGDARANEKMEKERASMLAQQCAESKRILFSKRARTDLTDGEKADLRRFEENYRARCA